MAVYFCVTDSNGVDCVDSMQGRDGWPLPDDEAETLAAHIATSYPDVIYFPYPSA